MMDQRLFEDAQKYIPGGVNSPVRSFKSVGGVPVFVKRGCGSKIYSEDGKEFLDYCLSWGALILGHANQQVNKAIKQAVENGTSFGTATKLEIELAKLITEAVPSIDQVRLVNSGTEAVMSAVRLSRAYTGKNKIIKFSGSYHGHADYLLVKAGSGLAALGIPDSLGVPKDFIKHTIICEYNNIENVKALVDKYKEDLAAIIVEPVAANCGVILPREDFLQELRKITKEYNIVLIFDEVITGFRLAYGGAQKFFNIKPDLTCLGKIIGGGMPIGAFGGRKEIMQLLAPVGAVYQAGTLSGNPVAVSSGIAVLNILKQNNPYKTLEEKTKKFCQAVSLKADEYKIKLKINHISSMFTLFFTDREVVNYETAQTQDKNNFSKFFHGLLKQGIYFSPSGFEANFISIAHSGKDLDKTLKIIDNVFSSY